MCVAIALVWLTACATSPLGRSQLLLHSSEEMDGMGIAAFQQISEAGTRAPDGVLVDYVMCVAATVGGLLGVGAQYGVLLPYSRTHETEADLYGLDLMARAGFDPRASVPLWENMAAAGGARPVEFLSTHPAPASRIEALEERIPRAVPLYEAALLAGGRPRCGAG